jgi:hypothetical protein
MSSRVARVEHDDAVAEIVRSLQSKARLIRLDGFMGVGKSCLGRQLANAIRAVIVDSDDFVSPSEEERSYLECVDLSELRRAVAGRLDAGDTVVLAAVCSQKLVPPQASVPEFSVYLKRLSFSTPNWPYWHHDPDVEDAPDRALERSIHEYHLDVRPHDSSSLILEIPEEGHCLSGPLPI